MHALSSDGSQKVFFFRFNVFYHFRKLGNISWGAIRSRTFCCCLKRVFLWPAVKWKRLRFYLCSIFGHPVQNVLIPVLEKVNALSSFDSLKGFYLCTLLGHCANYYLNSKRLMLYLVLAPR